MSSNVSRLGTANMYANTISTLTQRQKELSTQMEHVSTGKKVIRASDDPVAAAQAERARTRLMRIESDQRILDAQRASITEGESTLGNIVDALQEFRDVVVSAGNGAYSDVEREALSFKMQSLRDQILSYVNRKDSNGQPLFRGLDSLSTLFNGNGDLALQSGQAANGEFSIAKALDGALAFASINEGNGLLTTRSAASNTGDAWANMGAITNPSLASELIPPNSVTLSFSIVNGDTFVEISGETQGSPRTLAYEEGMLLDVQGMQIRVSGTPANGDSISVEASKTVNIFDVLDSSIAAVKNPGINGTPLSADVLKSLAEIDSALDKVSTVRSYAGTLLQRADSLDAIMMAREEQVETLRSSAEDIDMIDALSKLETMQTGVSAALQSYASVQKLSLFNYIS